jgi:hypothetical protein
MKQAAGADVLRSLHASYYERDAASSMTSSHWKPHTDAFSVDLDRMSIAGDGFGLPTGASLGRIILEQLCVLSYFVWMPRRRRLVALLARGLTVTRRMKVPFLWGAFRQLCILELLTPYVSGAAPTFLIVGDGYGFLSSTIKLLYPASRIVLVDLGKTLLFQAFYIQRVHPSATHVLVGRDGDFVYCPAEDLDRLRCTFDVVINVNSMQEMTMATIARYFQFFRAHGRPDNLFYCCNRESKTLPDGEVIAFENYPWSDRDRHLIDGYPRFQKYFIAKTFPYFTLFTGKARHRLTHLAVDQRGGSVTEPLEHGTGE